ncbi:hypothetical protein [Nocardioides sp. GCM10030258]|uniref:hypothetical protein n=1 Tax=unclassified Nocardioides TaxID=2615069 RepID=UPI00361F7709
MKKLAIATVLACCVSLSGCGGDDEPAKSDDRASETRDQALTKAELIEQGDAICKASNEKIDAADDRFIDPENPTEAEFRAAVNDTLVPEVKGQVEDLRALKAPAEDAATINEMLDSIEAGLVEVEADPLAILQGDPFADANKIAQDYGFEVCGAS